ncbi:glycosyltransferase family 2 protein [Candidatus Methanomassiliicoccus intestinalis]|uniref:glycosyltransferase family 2 protein n=1 Tax=Candidatus Methanomassiliicoccus intestinalis TaxID=1406512 RepID=UPI0037DC3E85
MNKCSLESNILTVVVPTHNSVRYLSRCLDSILNQSLKTIEIIIVDSSSSDDTPRLIEDYCQTYDNITCISLDYTASIGASRNIGLSHAKSRYISFLDSDDWIDSNAYLSMYKSIDNSNSDIAICGIKTEYGNSMSSTIRYDYPYMNEITGHFALHLLSRCHAQDVYISPMVSNKLYRTSFLKNNELSFPNSNFSEDNEFAFLTYVYSRNVMLVPGVYSHYFQRDDSITHQYIKEQIDGLINTFTALRTTLDNKGIFHQFHEDYYAFFEKCCNFILTVLYENEQTEAIQKKYLNYLIHQISGHLNTKELIDYFDITRIYNFFRVYERR